jgi:hypothetical protein
MPEGMPSAMDYLRWLSTEISSLLDMFGGINENFITAVVKGVLIMAGSYVDLDALQDVAIASGVAKWWRSFGYNYMLDAIHAMLHEVITNV